MSDKPQKSQFHLLTIKRFAPFFGTQFLGAFNDNVFKNALMGMVTYGVLSTSLDLTQMNNLGAMLFIMPFFLFSAIGGQLADKYDKAQLIRYIKLAEIIIMSFGALCFLIESTVGLMVMLFLMGSQTAFFGPAKYGLIPQHLNDDELIGGNALVETGTFLAILTGTIGAGLISTQENSLTLAAIAVLALSVAGYLMSTQIPPAPPKDAGMKIDFNPITANLYTLRFCRRNPSVFMATIGISWFWFVGASYLTQIFVFTKDYLHGDQGVVTVLLATFSIGIALGSLLCERLSGHKLELGLVPFAVLGITLAGIDLYFAPAFPVPTELINAASFIAIPQAWKIILDFFLLGTFGGLYVVPLFTLVQKRGEAAHLSRIIAAIAIVNALFMILSAVLAMILIGLLKWTIPEYFLWLAGMNILVAAFMFHSMPEFIDRFLRWSKLRSSGDSSQL
jgi:predicted MFS family arabinose efflux permease